MNYFLDQEFIEGFRKPLFGRRRHFIDLISIALVCEDGTKYYALCSEFDLKKAWRDAWLREHVLRNIHSELLSKVSTNQREHFRDMEPFTLKTMYTILSLYGKTREEILSEVRKFISDGRPVFYGYYCDYDWVLFCSLFGRMIDLPEGYPMYCIDLKQEIDNLAKKCFQLGVGTHSEGDKKNFPSVPQALEWLKESPLYPAQSNEHNALADAIWISKLYDFLQINHLCTPHTRRTEKIF